MVGKWGGRGKQTITSAENLKMDYIAMSSRSASRLGKNNEKVKEYIFSTFLISLQPLVLNMKLKYIVILNEL